MLFLFQVKERSDRLMNYFLIGHFFAGLALAFFYDTWLIAFGVGGLLLAAYYSVKMILPDSDLYQYVLSVVYGVFMAQFIYQMHGLFEMHFFAFIGSAILITYQKWKLQIPITIVVVVHHASLGYLQNVGDNRKFTSHNLNFSRLEAFIIHVVLAAVIFFICGLWAYQLKKYNEIQLLQTIRVAELQKEAQFYAERQKHAEILEKTKREVDGKYHGCNRTWSAPRYARALRDLFRSSTKQRKAAPKEKRCLNICFYRQMNSTR